VSRLPHSCPIGLVGVGRPLTPSTGIEPGAERMPASSGTPRVAGPPVPWIPSR
jgi:hypothetical protein